MTELNFNTLNIVKLQLIENIILRKLNEVDDIKNSEELISKEEKLIELEGKLEAYSKKYSELENERKKLEDRVGTQSEKIKRNEQKLFSGTITSSKELVNLQDEIKILKENNDKIEDKMLELMIKIDEILEEIREIKTAKEKLDLYVGRLKNDIGEKVKKLEENIEELKKEKDNLILSIPDDYIKEYKRLKEKKMGIAVSVLKDDICSGCSMQIPVTESEKIKDKNKVYRCPLCGRLMIIYRNELENIKKELEV